MSLTKDKTSNRFKIELVDERGRLFKGFEGDYSVWQEPKVYGGDGGSLDRHFDDGYSLTPGNSIPGRIRNFI